MCVPAKSLQSCSTLCDCTDCSPSGSSVHAFSRQEYWSGLPCPPPGRLPDPEKELPTQRKNPRLYVSCTPLAPPGKPRLGLGQVLVPHLVFFMSFPSQDLQRLSSPVSLLPLVFLPLGWHIALCFHLLTYEALGPLLPWKHLEWESSL